jgi:Flp pilus assembly pilin Flp
VSGAAAHQIDGAVGAPARRAGRGQGVVEYGLILGLSAVLALGILVFAGGTVADVLALITEAVDAAEGR